jgi:hypothetical protein
MTKYNLEEIFFYYYLLGSDGSYWDVFCCMEGSPTSTIPEVGYREMSMKFSYQLFWEKFASCTCFLPLSY